MVQGNPTDRKPPNPDDSEEDGPAMTGREPDEPGENRGTENIVPAPEEPENDPEREAAIYLHVLPVLADLEKIGFDPERDAEAVVRTVLKSNPKAILENAKQFIDKPFAREVLLEATDRAPITAIIAVKEYIDTPFGNEILEKAARGNIAKHPEAIFDYAFYIVKLSSARELFIAAASQKIAPSARQTAIHLFQNLKHFVDQPYIEDVLLAMIENDGAWFVFDNAETLLEQKFAERIFRAAMQKNPRTALFHLKKYAQAPFAENIVMELVRGIPLYTPEATQKRTGEATGDLRFMVPNRSEFSIDFLAEILPHPFAERIFTELARINPGLVKACWFLERAKWGPALIASLNPVK